MTPVLVLFFNVPPLAAVSSDLVASAVMKPVGSFVHLRRGTVNLGLVKWLCLGSVPAAFCGVLVARALGDGDQVQDVIQLALGVALLIAAAGLIVRAYLRLVERARRRDGSATRCRRAGRRRVRPIPDGHRRRGRRPRRRPDLGRLRLADHHRADGALPRRCKASELVGTDLVQAVPLVISAALGHILFGDFQLDLTTSLLLGCLPGRLGRRAALVPRPGRPRPPRPRLRPARLGAEDAGRRHCGNRTRARGRRRRRSAAVDGHSSPTRFPGDRATFHHRSRGSPGHGSRERSLTPRGLSTSPADADVTRGSGPGVLAARGTHPGAPPYQPPKRIIWQRLGQRLLYPATARTSPDR